MVLAGFFAMMVSYGTLYCFGVFFKPVSGEFGWTRAETSGAYSLYQIMHGVFAIIAGRLGDKFNPRLVITACGVILGSGYLLMSHITSLWQYYLYYGVLVSTGMTYYLPLMSTVARCFVKRRGLMGGIVLSGTGIGTIIMPPIATQLISNYNWSTSYLIIGCLALVIVVIAAQFVRRGPDQISQPSYGAEAVNRFNPETPVFTVKKAIRTGQFWMFSVALFCFIFCQQVVLVHIVPYATDVGMSAVSAASILSVIGGISITGRIGLGSASDRTGCKSAWVIALASASIALFWLLLVARELWSFYLFAAIFGFGYGGVMAVQSPMVAELFGLRSHGAIYGMALFVGMIGGAVGPIVGGRIVDVSGSYQTALLITAMVGATGLILGLLSKFYRKVDATR